MKNPDPKEIAEHILQTTAGSEEQMSLITQEFQLAISGYLKRGYWRYVQEALRSAMLKVLGRYPGQKEFKQGAMVHLSHDEVCFLRALLSGTVGGDPDGPRKYSDSIIEKLDEFGFRGPNYHVVLEAWHVELVED